MEEFHRVKKYPIQFSEVKLVDAMGIYHSKEKRDLSAAVKFYCKREHDLAHSAKADVLATIDIVKRQLLMYEDLKPNISFLHDYLNTGNNVDLNGKFVRDGNGKVVFNFGQHKGKEACNQSQYLKWMFEKGEFAIDTKMVATRIYKNCLWEEQIKSWIKDNKLTQTKELASALYATVKFGEDIFPFATKRIDNKLTVMYLVEPTASYTLVHQDAIDILLNFLNAAIRA